MPIYIAVYKNSLISHLEYLEEPLYITWLYQNNAMVFCSREYAMGVISAQDNSVLPFSEQMSKELGLEYYAEIITEEQYFELGGDSETKETLPPIETATDLASMSRGELTARVKFLEDCVLELSEAVYNRDPE